MNQATARSTSWFVGFALSVVIVLLIVLYLQIDRRNDSIEVITESAARIETAAVHTEEVLLEVVEASESPEAQAQQRAIREALGQIRQIHDILCSAPELAEAAECDG